MTPGAYLRKRREHARLGLRQAAASIAALPWAVTRAGPLEINRLQQRLQAAEDDREPFDRRQVELIRNVVPLDPEVYAALVLRHADGIGSNLPDPQVCRTCACSWHDPCATSHGPCAWASADLCTGCATVAAVERELGPNIRIVMPGVPA